MELGHGFLLGFAGPSYLASYHRFRFYVHLEVWFLQDPNAYHLGDQADSNLNVVGRVHMKWANGMGDSHLCLGRIHLSMLEMPETRDPC